MVYNFCSRVMYFTCYFNRLDWLQFTQFLSTAHPTSPMARKLSKHRLKGKIEPPV